MELNHNPEWLETDGRGGYASGTWNGLRTRKYHSYLTVAKSPPVERTVLVSDLHFTVHCGNQTYNLTAQQYKNALIEVADDVHVQHVQFPIPKTTYTITGIGTITKEWFVVHGTNTLVCTIECSWQHPDASLHIRPLFSGRPHHALTVHQEPWEHTYAAEDSHCWQHKDEQIFMQTTSKFVEDSCIYEQILYTEEQNRGYDCIEQNYSPGYFCITESATQILCSSEPIMGDMTAKITAENNRRSAYNHHLQKIADDFIVKRATYDKHDSKVPTIVAGYPWFTDWGRDTFIAMRGLLFTTERYKEAEQLLLFWAKQVQDGLLPNRFIDEDNEPEFNSIDSPLWFVVVCYELLKHSTELNEDTKHTLQEACKHIVQNLKTGTRYNIHQQEDGLLYCGEAGVQLTWMDALYNGNVITPRIGKPVEIQCLWLNALHILDEWNLLATDEVQQAKNSFIKQFWNEELGYLNDVVAADGIDISLRPNQLFAIGYLPFTIVDDAKKQQRVLLNVQNHLRTPLGMRTLNPEHEEYIGTYAGSQAKRDAAYHQGTAWPWLLGPYCDVYFTVHGISEESKQHVAAVWEDCYTKSQPYGSGGICEVASGSTPHTPNGCPWQAWSVSEYLRIEKKYNL